MQDSGASGAIGAARRAFRRRRATVMITVGVVFGMVGLSFAAVPLYDLFCQVTGYGGTTQRADAASDRVLDRVVRVQFDANISSDLGWEFQPAQRSVRVRLGESAVVEYTALNVTDQVTAGTATFNVAPESVGAYFNKIECFCFTAQTLGPGETMAFPVLFFVDPALADNPMLDHIDTITLSYTFYPSTPAGTLARAGAGGGG